MSNREKTQEKTIQIRILFPSDFWLFNLHILKVCSLKQLKKEMIVMNLYEITELQKELEREEDAEAKQDLQELISIELKNKSNNIVYVIKNLEGNNAAIDAEIERLQALKRRNSSNIEKIKSNILWFMQQNNIDTIKSDLAIS